MTRVGIKVDGLAEVLSAAAAARKTWGKDQLAEIRRELTPMRDASRARFAGLGGTGPKVAATARTIVGAKSAALAFGSPKLPFGMGREFGAKRDVTRPHTRRVQSGPMARRRVGGGESREFVARIPYSSPSIFGAWTGNQFSLGDDGGRISVDQVSGRAFYPVIGAGAQRVYDRLEQVIENTVARFPGPTV